MLLIDDLVLSPYKGLKWIFKEIHHQAQEQQNGEAERIRDSLTELYRQLETGAISEAEFDRQEELLLDRLDVLEEHESYDYQADAEERQQSPEDTIRD